MTGRRINEGMGLANHLLAGRAIRSFVRWAINEHRDKVGRESQAVGDDMLLLLEARTTAVCRKWQFSAEPLNVQTNVIAAVLQLCKHLPVGGADRHFKESNRRFDANDLQWGPQQNECQWKSSRFARIVKQLNFNAENR